MHPEDDQRATAATAHAATNHGSGHEAEHADEGPGPIDVEFWGAGIVAAAIGLLMAFCFVLATAGSGPY